MSRALTGIGIEHSYPFQTIAGMTNALRIITAIAGLFTGTLSLHDSPTAAQSTASSVVLIGMLI